MRNRNISGLFLALGGLLMLVGFVLAKNHVAHNWIAIRLTAGLLLMGAVSLALGVVGWVLSSIAKKKHETAKQEYSRAREKVKIPAGSAIVTMKGQQDIKYRMWLNKKILCLFPAAFAVGFTPGLIEIPESAVQYYAPMGSQYSPPRGFGGGTYTNTAPLVPTWNGTNASYVRLSYIVMGREQALDFSADDFSVLSKLLPGKDYKRVEAERLKKAVPRPSGSSEELRLLRLLDLKEKNLISAEEYEKKKREILAAL